ncbi:MAG: hypothetical protein AAF485_10725, partial [Chloroflexota bacterium]
VEVNFLDVLTRRAVRVAGQAEIIEKTSEEGQQLMPAFEAAWEPYISHMENFVSISITRAELIVSPAYDMGHTREDLHATNLEKLSNLG